MACSTKTLKIISLIWDAIYEVLGVLVASLGIYLFIKFEYFHTTAFVVFGIGVIVFLAGAFGCLSAIRESNRLLKTFVVILIILIVLQLLAISVFWIFKTSLLVNVDNTFDQLWHGQTIPIKPEGVGRIESLEKWLECCGNSGPSDYLLPPYSCYTDNNRLNLDGCRQKFLDYISDRWIAFNIFGIILVVVELICAIFAYVLGNSILNRWRRSKYFPK